MGAFSGREKDPPRRTGRLAQAKLADRNRLRHSGYLPYQGARLRSCACGDCSGRSPAIYSSAMSRTPAHPPPTRAAATHQNETIWLPPFPWSRELPGTDAAPRLRCSKKNPACAGRVVHHRRPLSALILRFATCHTEPGLGIRVVARGADSAALRTVWTKNLKKSGLNRVFGWPCISLPH